MHPILETRPVDAQKGIDSIDSLCRHLEHAAVVELSTIPLYLYAAYSIKTSGYDQWAPGISAFRAIRSVVIEEMLHLALARNLLVAVGGGDDFKLYDPAVVPKYPEPMLHRVPDLMLQLEPCSRELMRTIFMPLELPEKTDAPPQPHYYNTLGQFYDAIKAGFITLADDPGLWADNRPDLQYAATYWNQDGGGSPIVVYDQKSALAAIATIVEQGEGAKPGDHDVPLDPADPGLGLTELSHYAKFHRIAREVDQIGEVWPVPVNPTVAEFARECGVDAPIPKLARFFNAAYSYVLAMIDAIYTTSRTTLEPGRVSPRYGLERTFIGSMNGVLYPIASLLVSQRLPNGSHAAPTFEFHQFDPVVPKKDQLAALCDELVGKYPVLGGDDGVRRLISLLPAV